MSQTMAFESPVGWLEIRAEDGRLQSLQFTDRARRSRAASAGRRVGRDLEGPYSALVAYFGGELTALDDIEVDVSGTDFQRRVWKALRTVPVGEVVSYGQLAATIGRPRAARAVGQANHVNPVAIVVPCHRVVAAGGGLGGYGGGLERKRWLLTHEGAGQFSALAPELSSV